MSKMNSEQFISEVRELVEWKECHIYTDDVCDLLKEYLDRLKDFKSKNTHYQKIIESYHNFTKLDPKSVFRMNRDSKQSYHELLKENKELSQRLYKLEDHLLTLEEKIVGDGLEYLLED